MNKIKLKKSDYSKKLVGQVKQELQLSKKFINKHLIKFINSSVRTYIKKSSNRNTKKINFYDVTNSSTGQSDVLRSYSRVLGFNISDYKSFEFKNYNEESDWINIFDFSGDINFSIQKIKEIKNSFPSFDFCSILTESISN